ncbi:DUF2461 domain-containing protein [Hymenobacter sp. PAMC 26628]|uniref:DUF2461 domain-containing protein n=1 Tax=Hymenobacter sp. PAMC 26628 TaxID=1484118 RepID=UPI0007700494|nr:DUF2461 domain-containing protein [Hymenobacter sp. PAMC 26628]AMJ64917.1 hypothetical protein AXW84_05365 [Hymenobacter sp. PAMC 26628]
MDLAYLLDFLRRLAANNNTPWMAEHRPDYQRARAAFAELIGQVLAEVAKTDPSLAGLTPTEAMFRLHKNDRGHRDPEPYKRRMGAGLLHGGRHAARAGYYLGVQPDGKSSLRVGFYHTTPALLGALRQEIHYNADEFHRQRQAPALLRHFPAGLTTDGEQLVRPPKGYPADHPDLGWLKLKSFGAVRTFTDEEVAQGPSFVALAVAAIAAARPLVDFFNEALEPNG